MGFIGNGMIDTCKGDFPNIANKLKSIDCVKVRFITKVCARQSSMHSALPPVVPKSG